MISTDIVIVGGGCVGLTAALALAQQGMAVTVIDKAGGATSLDEPELRVSAISAGSEQLLKSIGAWQHLDAERLQAYDSMSVWDKESFGRIDFSANDVAEHRLGHIIENNHIRNALLQQAEASNNLTLLLENEIASIHNDDEQMVLTLADGKPLIAKLLIAADGANSWVRKQLGLTITFSDYDHHALVATVRTAAPHGHCARQVFLPNGPLALLPLYDESLCSIVWSTSPDEANQLQQMDAAEFGKRLTAASDSVLGPVELESARVSFPLTMRYAHTWVDNRVVLIGDAAHTIHPLAGLGMNLGLMDAAALAQSISNKELLSSQRVQKSLRQYERWRKAEAQTFIAAMAGLKHLFDGQNPVKKLIRGVGLALTNQTPVVKHQIIRHAMGVAGELPNLARAKDPI